MGGPGLDGGSEDNTITTLMDPVWFSRNGKKAVCWLYDLNRIDAEGAVKRVLADTRVRSVRVAGIGDDPTVAAKLIRSHPTATELEVWGFGNTAQDREAVARAVRDNPRIETLVLTGDDRGVVSVLRALEGHPALTTLGLREFPVNGETIPAIGRLVERNLGIVKISLDRDRVEIEVEDEEEGLDEDEEAEREEEEIRRIGMGLTGRRSEGIRSQRLAMWGAMRAGGVPDDLAVDTVRSFFPGNLVIQFE